MPFLQGCYHARQAPEATVLAEVGSRLGQSTPTLPPSGSAAGRRQTRSPPCAGWVHGSLLDAQGAVNGVPRSSVGKNLPHPRFSPGSLPASTGGQVALPFPAAGCCTGQPQETPRALACGHITAAQHTVTPPLCCHNRWFKHF